MKHTTILVTALCMAALGGCGVDGEPTAPQAKPQPGISINGRAEVGVAKRS